jgi:hypothetical protein
MLFVISTAVIGVSTAVITLQDANAASNNDNSSCSHHDTTGNPKNAPKMIHL